MPTVCQPAAYFDITGVLTERIMLIKVTTVGHTFPLENMPVAPVLTSTLKGL